MCKARQRTASFSFITFLLLSAFLPLSAPLSAAPSPSQNSTTITVVSDDNYPPYIFRDAQGNLQGIVVDEWAQWEKKTGIKVVLRGMDWGKAQKFMAEGKADVIDTMFKTDERERRYDFTKPYTTLDVPIFFHKNISGISDGDSLRGFVVGVKEGDACVDRLQQVGISTLKTYHNYEHIVQAAAGREISVFCMDESPALYYLYKFAIAREYRQSKPLYTGQFHRAVKKGGTGLLGVVDGGFAKITAREHDEIEKKWRGSSLHADTAAGRNILYSTAGIGAIALLLVLWNMMLHKRVASRTAELLTTVADLRNKEADLSLSEKKFSTLFLSSPDSIAITDAHGVFTEINERFPVYLGYQRDEIIGKTVIGLDIWAFPEERKVFRRALAATGLVNSMETSFRTKQGAIVPCLVSGREVNIEGKPHVISMVTDISRMRAIEDDLRRSQKFSETIFNSIDEAIAIVAVHDLTIIDGNRVFIGKSGLPKDQVVGKRCHEISHRSSEPCIAHGEACPISAMVESRSATTLEHCHALPDGLQECVEITAHPIFDKAGNIVQAVYVTRDITARKLADNRIRKSEERYRNLFDSTLDGVYEVNAEGAFMQMNAAGARIFGFGSPEEIVGRNALEFWRDPEDREAFREELVLNKSLSAYPMAAQKKDGMPIEIESTCRVIEDGEGKYLGIAGILRDVTERRRAEAEREKLIQQLQRALAEVRTLSGMLPICSSCKKIRDDKGYWNQIESYVTQHSGAEFTHGICPECEKKVYEELNELTKGMPKKHEP